MSALLFGYFACYAVTGKCDLPADNAGRDIAVFASLEDCRRFGSASARQPPGADGRWTIDATHYYQCFALTPMPVAKAAPPPVAAPPTAAVVAPGPAAVTPPPGATAVAPSPGAAAVTPPPSAATAAPPPGATAVAPSPAAHRAVYKTTAEALQRDFGADPEALTQKIGDAVVEVTGKVDNTAAGDGTALELSARRWDVTAWLTPDGVAAARKIAKRQYVTLRCDSIGTLVAATARTPAVVEARECKPVSGGG